MIISLSANKEYILYRPEGVGELTKLEGFSGLSRSTGVFFTPNKLNIFQDVYRRLRANPYLKNIKYTSEITEMITQRMELKEIPPTFKYHTTPKGHQQIALRYCFSYKNLGLLLEPGMGKTKVVYDYLHLENFPLTLVGCPKPLCDVWVQEALDHRPEMRPYVFQTTNFIEEYEKAKEQSANILILNYNKVVTLEPFLQKLPINCIVLDEGLIKDPSTERTKAFTRMSTMKSVSSRIIMSGTLVNNTPLDIFAPIRFIEPSILGTSVTRFKDEYAITKKISRDSANKMVVGYKNVESLRTTLEAVSIVMTKAEWLELPEKVVHDINVDISDKQEEDYESLSKNYTVTLDNGEVVEANNILSIMIKMYQISNGFLYVSHEDAKDSDELILDLFSNSEKSAKAGKKPKKSRTIYRYDEQPKATALKSLLKNQLKDERTVIWFNMSEEANIISEALTEEGYEFLVIQGGDKNISQKIREFNTNPNIKALVCQAKSVNYGVTILGDQRYIEEDSEGVLPSLNPAICNSIFYSLNFSLEVYLQQMDRIHRIGQERVCHYWRLVSNTFIEEKIVSAVDGKLKLNRQMLVDVIGRYIEERKNDSEV